MDGTGVRQWGGGGGGGRVQGEPWGCGLTAAVKAGNAGFRIESYGIFVSQILGTFVF